MDRQSELMLVGRLREGDATAFDAVYEEFHARLYNFLARLCRRRDVAEDLLEETWLRFVTHASRLRPDTCLAPWLFTVARNLYVSYLRSRALDESLQADLIGLWPVTAGHRPSPFEEAALSDLERRTERALARLPRHYREALLLVAGDGFSTAEAAEVCMISPDAMRQRVSRARGMLARELDAAAGRLAPAPLEVVR
jgi:RNA polymerase sigma-70 factor (ECF subfamily)